MDVDSAILDQIRHGISIALNPISGVWVWFWAMQITDDGNSVLNEIMSSFRPTRAETIRPADRPYPPPLSYI